MWIETGGELVDISQFLNIYKKAGQTVIVFVPINTTSLSITYDSSSIRNDEFERIKKLLLKQSPGINDVSGLMPKELP